MIPNFGYHLARLHGGLVRRIYRRLLPAIVRRQIDPPRSLALEVYAYSNEAMLPEQVASIRSFLRHAGRPTNFTVVSDGSHSPRSIRLLEQIDASVSVSDAGVVAPELPERFRSYLTNNPTGKQLALLMTLPRRGPALYVDSDVLFFRGASDLARRVTAPETSAAPAFYLPDCRFSGDRRLLRHPDEEKQPVNAGFLLIQRKIDWSSSMARFLELEGEPIFFTNQTLTHLAMHENAAQPLDPVKYVLQLDDQFVFSDRYAGAALALRHYVNPVRHKFWTSLNK